MRWSVGQPSADRRSQARAHLFCLDRNSRLVYFQSVSFACSSSLCITHTCLPFFFTSCSFALGEAGAPTLHTYLSTSLPSHQIRSLRIYHRCTHKYSSLHHLVIQEMRPALSLVVRRSADLTVCRIVVLNRATPSSIFVNFRVAMHVTLAGLETVAPFQEPRENICFPPSHSV
jgi:hypothetical protein